MRGFHTNLLPAHDLAASRDLDLYRDVLGSAPVPDQPYYVVFKVDGQHSGLVQS